ncbi:unnamed protein product [Calypogeia fissa]
MFTAVRAPLNIILTLLFEFFEVGGLSYSSWEVLLLYRLTKNVQGSTGLPSLNSMISVHARFLAEDKVVADTAASFDTMTVRIMLQQLLSNTLDSIACENRNVDAVDVRSNIGSAATGDRVRSDLIRRIEDAAPWTMKDPILGLSSALRFLTGPDLNGCLLFGTVPVLYKLATAAVSWRLAGSFRNYFETAQCWQTQVRCWGPRGRVCVDPVGSLRSSNALLRVGGCRKFRVLEDTRVGTTQQQYIARKPVRGAGKGNGMQQRQPLSAGQSSQLSRRAPSSSVATGGALHSFFVGPRLPNPVQKGALATDAPVSALHARMHMIRAHHN